MNFLSPVSMSDRYVALRNIRHLFSLASSSLWITPPEKVLHDLGVFTALSFHVWGIIFKYHVHFP